MKINSCWPIGNFNTTQLDRQLLLKRLSSFPANKFLDTGAGNGQLTVFIAEAVQAQEIHAVDIQNICSKPEIKFNVSDLNQPLPYPDNYFDLVTSIHTIEHLYDTDLYLEEIYRILKPGGYLFIDTVNLAALHYRLMLLLGYQPNCLAPSRWQINPFKGDHGDHPHKSVFTFKALIQVVKKHGFLISHANSHTIYPLPFLLGYWLCSIWPNIGLFSHLVLHKPTQQASSELSAAIPE